MATFSELRELVQLQGNLRTGNVQHYLQLFPQDTAVVHLKIQSLSLCLYVYTEFDQ